MITGMILKLLLNKAGVNGIAHSFGAKNVCNDGSITHQLRMTTAGQPLLPLP